MSTLRNSLSRGPLLQPPPAYFGRVPPLTRFARGFLRLYSFLFPGRESLQSAKHLANWNAVRLHIGVGGFCALGAPFCLLFLWLREPFLQIFQVIAASMIYLRGKWRTPHPTTQDGVEATDDGSQLSSKDDADAQVQRMLESAGVRDFQKYLENPIIDPEVRPNEVELGATVEHMKLLRNLLEKRFSDLGEGFEKKFNDLGEGLEKKFNDRVGLLEKKVDDLGESLDKKVGEHGDCQENNLNSFKVDFNAFKTDVLEILRGDQRLMDK